MSRSFLLASLLLATSASAALGQTARVASNAPARPVSDLGAVKQPDAICCLSRLTAEEAARIAREIDEATTLTFQGRMTEARRLLRKVVDEQERADAYPGVALKMLANIEYSLDRPIVAAGLMVRLADVAAEAGDPATELEALLDAAALYNQTNRRTDLRALRPRVRNLLDSPAIPEDRRQAIAGRFPPA